MHTFTRITLISFGIFVLFLISTSFFRGRHIDIDDLVEVVVPKTSANPSVNDSSGRCPSMVVALAAAQAENSILQTQLTTTSAALVTKDAELLAARAKAVSALAAAKAENSILQTQLTTTSAALVTKDVELLAARAKADLQTKHRRRAECMSLLEPINPKPVKSYSYISFHRAMRDVKRVLDVCPRPFANTKRLVLIDLGSNTYNYSAETGGSTKSFQDWYPRGNEFHVHNFEPLIQFAEGYKECKMCTFHNAVLGVGSGYLSFMNRSKEQADNSKAQFHTTNDNGPKDANFTVLQYDIAAWFLENLSRENDFVVLKMDIEFGEWSILPYMEEKNLWVYVDEFFFECHHAGMSDRYVTKTYKDCQRVLEDLRSKLSVATHAWYL